MTSLSGTVRRGRRSSSGFFDTGKRRWLKAASGVGRTGADASGLPPTMGGRPLPSWRGWSSPTCWGQAHPLCGGMALVFSLAIALLCSRHGPHCLPGQALLFCGVWRLSSSWYRPPLLMGVITPPLPGGTWSSPAGGAAPSSSAGSGLVFFGVWPSSAWRGKGPSLLPG